MDTDDLSVEAYTGILDEAEKLSSGLTLHYGLLSYECSTEVEYIEKAENLTRRFLKSTASDLYGIFMDQPPKIENFMRTLKTILENIDLIKSIPVDKRTY
jgi:uncharacterized protein YyaL (SSP411 family)